MVDHRRRRDRRGGADAVPVLAGGRRQADAGGVHDSEHPLHRRQRGGLRGSGQPGGLLRALRRSRSGLAAELERAAPSFQAGTAARLRRAGRGGRGKATRSRLRRTGRRHRGHAGVRAACGGARARWHDCHTADRGDDPSGVPRLLRRALRRNRPPRLLPDQRRRARCGADGRVHGGDGPGVPEPRLRQGRARAGPRADARAEAAPARHHQVDLRRRLRPSVALRKCGSAWTA